MQVWDMKCTTKIKTSRMTEWWDPRIKHIPPSSKLFHQCLKKTRYREHTGREVFLRRTRQCNPLTNLYQWFSSDNPPKFSGYNNSLGVIQALCIVKESESTIQFGWISVSASHNIFAKGPLCPIQPFFFGYKKTIFLFTYFDRTDIM